MRVKHLIWFYELMGNLETKIDGCQSLDKVNGRNTFPERGVYFFQENGETRSDTGEGLRIVRVGTHALTSGAKSSLWGRLKSHKGNNKNGGGNHRGSVFRLLLGASIAAKNPNAKNWGVGSNASVQVRQNELPIEIAVSKIVRQMPFLYLNVPDVAGPQSLRGVIERNSIALLSNFNKKPLDPASANWRGLHCCAQNSSLVKESGLWNKNHVEENYDPQFLDQLEMLIKAM